MEKSDVIDYFKEYETLLLDIKERELNVPLKSEFIISIVGPRRAGKTYFLLYLSKKIGENYLYLNFEDSRLAGISHKEIRDIIRVFIELYGKPPHYLFLDEVQEIDKWERVVRELHDLKKYRIFLTGSSSKLLSKEIATQLRGRTLSFTLLPLSFREFLRFKNKKIPKYMSRDDEAKVRNFLREYLEFGGFPDVVKNEQKVKILKEYSDLVLFRDFIERHKIKNIEVARMLHSFMLQNFSKEISIKKLFDRIKTKSRVAKDTVYNYVTKLEDTLFFFFLKKFSLKAHIRETWPKKIYLCDTGLSKVVRFSPDYGRLMENAVFTEFIRKQNTNPLLEIFYFPFTGGEVDFVVKESTEIKQLIQVTYASAEDEIERREIKSLLKAYEKLRCKDLAVITWDYEDEKIIKGEKIRFIPLWKWILTRL